jgi:hypothetical protein
VRAAGVSDDALVDAVVVAGLFNMIVRVADSFAFEVLPYESFLARAQWRLGEGYALLSVPVDGGVDEDAEPQRVVH